MTGPSLRKILFIVLFIIFIAVVYLALPPRQTAVALQGSTATPAVNPLTQVMLYAFVEAPTGSVSQPYIVLTGYGDLPNTSIIKLRGTINDNLSFTCTGSPCKLNLTADSVVRFYAYTDQGDQSGTVVVTARMTKPSATEYTITLDYNNPALLYHDSCASIWNAYSGPYPAWAQMPNTPAQLNTNQNLYYLAASLIRAGVVDASSCANGGLDSRYSPNGCGMEKAAAAMTEWQNKFDLDLWLTGGSVGLPPKMLKTLFARESQFWPASTRYFLNEYGLAQINDFGADTALRWDPTLYQQVCSGVLNDCSTPYNRDDFNVQAMMRGALISELNADCPTCQYGINLNVAHTSVYVIARVLHANCWETRYTLDAHDVDTRNYEDLWKLTMVAYHSGYYCLDYAVKAAADADLEPTWENIAPRLACQGARDYVDNFWAALNSFDSQVVVPSSYVNASVNVLPTATPGPTPSQAANKVRVRVRVYVDTNGDSVYQPSEGVSGVSVKLTLSDNTVQTATTDAQGMANFDLTGRPVSEVVIVTLPDQFRRENIILPDSGVVDVTFKFNQPILPTSNP